MARRRAGLAGSKRSLSRLGGFDGVDKMLGKIGTLRTITTLAETKAVFVKCAAIARDEIKDRAPVVTGTLKGAIFAGGGSPDEANALVGVNYRKAPHAHLVEFGTVHSAPHAFFRPGLQAAVPKVADALKDGLKDVIERELARRS